MSAKASLVLELQDIATDTSTDIAELLRKALLVATKLGLEDFRVWIEHELSGYADSDVPEYRKATAEIRLQNPYHGLIPVIMEDAQLHDILCEVNICDSIGSLQEILRTSGGKQPILTIPLAPAQVAFIMKHQRGSAKLPPVRIIGRNQIASVVDGVRNAVLRWALTLESDGILGEGMTFSKHEKELASTSSNINIHNFQGVFGNVAHSDLVQNLTITVKQGDIDSLVALFRQQGIIEEDLQALRSAITQDATTESDSTFGPGVANWIGMMVGKAASGAWSISTGAAANLLADAIGAYYGV